MTKDETKQMYGIAILMMLCHHLFRTADPTNYLSVLNLFLGKEMIRYIANFCGICVAIYAFITGYGFSEYAKRKEFVYSGSDFKEICGYVIKHIVGLYKKYWLVFLIFVPLGCLTKSYEDYGIKTIILSLIGLDSSFCGAWWYVWQYAILCTAFPLQMILLDVLTNIIKKKSINLNYRNAGIIFTFFFSLTIILWALDGFTTVKVVYGIICFLGCISSRYSLISKGKELLNRFGSSNFICLGVIAIMAILRVYQRMKWGGVNGLVDIVLIIPFFICTCKLLENREWITTKLQYFGGKSTYMWLIHNFFLTTNLAIVIRIVRVAAFRYVMLVVLSCFCSMIIKGIEKKLQRLVEK